MRGSRTAERRILNQSRRARAFLYSSVSLGFLAAALFAAQAVLLSDVVNRVFLLRQPLSAVLPALALMALLLLVRAGLIWAGDVLAQRAASDVKRGLRAQLTAHLLALGPIYTRGERSGELVNTTVEGVEALDEYVAQYLPAMSLAALAPTLVLLLVFVLDAPTVIVLLLAGPFLLLLLALIGGRAKQITERRFLEMSWMSAHFLDMLQGLATLKMFGRSKEQVENIANISSHYGNTTMDVLRTAFQTSLVMEWAATAATAFVAFTASFRLMHGTLDFERAFAVILLTPEFFLPLRQLAVRYHAGTAGKAAARRIFDVLDTPPRAEQTSAGRKVRRLEGWKVDGARQFDIAFEDVSFAYDGGQRPALRDFSLSMRQGQTVALVGATGAGKSTVASLLLRFIEPDSGAIIVGGGAGGVPLDQLDCAEWRAHVAWVPQLPHLFHGTIADNIRLARPGACIDKVVTAAQAAHAHEFIQVLPHGYDTPIGEKGARLSGGQQQRIAIARAFLKDAPVLILDEPTSHLDAASEESIRDALARLMRNRTTLIIAHRLKLAYAADQIVVMDHGRAVEAGEHGALLAQDGAYRRLVAGFEVGIA